MHDGTSKVAQQTKVLATKLYNTISVPFSCAESSMSVQWHKLAWSKMKEPQLTN